MLLPQAPNLETVEVAVAVTLDLGIPNVLELMSTACLFPESMLLFFTRFSCICQCLPQPFLTCFLNTRFCFLYFIHLATRAWDGNRHLNAVHKGNANSEHGGLAVGCLLLVQVACMSCLVSMQWWGRGAGTAVHRECGHVRRLQGQPATSWPQPLCCG